MATPPPTALILLNATHPVTFVFPPYHTQHNAAHTPEIHKKKPMYKAKHGICMPRRQDTTELQAFRFDSRDCKSFRASCTSHDRLFIRIRKNDLTDVLKHTTYGTSQIYVRAEQTESLQVQPGESLHIKIKSNVLVFQVASIHVLTSISQRP